MSATATAVLGSGYVPPFAKTTAVTGAGGAAATGTTSLSFAKVGTLSGVSTGGATATTSASIVDATGGVDSASLLEYFTKPYFDAHTLSRPSWRYAYIFWMFVAFTLVVWTLAYQFSPPGSGIVGAWFRKWSIRRIVIGGKARKDAGAAEQGGTTVKRKRMQASPTIAHMLAVVGLIGLAVCLSVLGDDYISPTTCTFGGTCPYNLGAGSKPPSRYMLIRYLNKRGVNNPNGWAPFNDPLLSSPNYNINANWWTAADRLGLVSYAMFPLVVSLSVKQWPFNFWASPFLTNYHFDKTAILHRWSGRVIWLFSSGHTATWLYELIIDKDPFGRPVLVDAFRYWRFVAGCAAYVALTAVVILSFKPIRNRHYELFYWSHVVLIIVFLGGCVIHTKPLMGWPVSALGLWGAERLTRLIIFVWINDYGRVNFPSRRRQRPQSFSLVGAEKQGETDAWETKSPDSYPPTSYDRYEEELRARGASGHAHGKRESFYNYGPGQDVQYLDRNHYPRPGAQLSLASTTPRPSYTTLSPPNQFTGAQLPLPPSQIPPGFALAQILPGRTIRLTLNVPSAIRWRPGQHIFLTIPSVKFLQAHPYTITNVDERAHGIVPLGGSSSLASEGSQVVLLVRAQKGFSKALWDYVVAKRRAKEASGIPNLEIVKGVSLRTLVSLPLGSAGRVTWDDYESLLIICGGTGITFGIAVLEHTCRRMAREASVARVRKGDKKFKTQRVRFVWILREFAHVSWVAPTLRRCLEMSSSSQLQVDIFVSRGAPSKLQPRRRSSPEATGPYNDLAPPTPAFARHAAKGATSRDSMDSDWSDSENDLPSPSQSQPFNDDDPIGGSVTEMILFDGEDDRATPTEKAISSHILQEGKLRRAKSRREQGYRKTAKTRPPHSPSPSHHNDVYPEDSPVLSRSAGSSFSPYHPQSYVEGGSTANLSGGWDPSDTYSFDASSVRRLVGDETSDARPDPQIDFSPSDQEDLDAVAELARPGHPRLDQLMDEEIEKSIGKTMVACCGPTELNTVVRHLVSDRIDLRKVMKGDPKGEISLILEDFSF